MTRVTKPTKRRSAPRRRQTDVNPLFAVGGKLVTLNEIEVAASYELMRRRGRSDEQDALIRLIPSLCMQIRVEARRTAKDKETP